MMNGVMVQKQTTGLAGTEGRMIWGGEVLLVRTAEEAPLKEWQGEDDGGGSGEWEEAREKRTNRLVRISEARKADVAMDREEGDSRRSPDEEEEDSKEEKGEQAESNEGEEVASETSRAREGMVDFKTEPGARDRPRTTGRTPAQSYSEKMGGRGRACEMERGWRRYLSIM